MHIDVKLHLFTDEEEKGRLSKIYTYYSGTKLKEEYKAYSTTAVGEHCLKYKYSYAGSDIVGQVASLVHWTQEMEDAVNVEDALFDNTKSTSFDGINDFVNFGDVHTYDTTDAFTVSMWIKPSNLAGYRVLFSKLAGASAYNGYSLRHNVTTGQLYLQLRAGTNRTWNYDLNLTAGIWQHLVFTYSGAQNISGANLYIDDVKATTPTSGGVSGTWLEGQDFMLGSRNGSFFLNGNMTEVTVWDKELSAVEVTELFNLGLPNDPTTHTASSNLKSYYRMGDNDVFPTITDNVSSDDGTMINMAAEDFEDDVPE